MAQDGCAIACGRLRRTTTQHGPQQTAQITQPLWHGLCLVTLQGAEQIGCTLCLRGILAQRPQQQGYSDPYGRLNLLRVDTQLLRHFLHGCALQLLEQLLRQRWLLTHMNSLAHACRMADTDIEKTCCSQAIGQV